MNVGFTTAWRIDTDGDGIADTDITPYNPNANDPVPEDLGNRCFDFGAGTPYPVIQGGTVVFEINNFQQGDARTPGYWKNWNRCTGGNQQFVADRNGGAAEGFFLLEDGLPQLIGDLLIPADPDSAGPTNGCEIAVDILDKRQIGKPNVVGDGKKSASDAAYNLATALLAYRLNIDVGVATCAQAATAASSAQALLDSIGFIGTGSYLPSNTSNTTLRQQALALAFTLDLFNNNLLCP